MSTVFGVLAIVCSIAYIIGWIFCLIAAFQDEVMRGIFCLICGIYALYYAVCEYNADNKNLVLLLMFGGTVGSILFRALAMTMR